MLRIILIPFLFISLSISAQKKDSLNHQPVSGGLNLYMSEDLDLQILSIRDSSFYFNWEENITRYQSEEPQFHILIAASPYDSFQQVEFIVEFQAQSRRRSNYLEAYQKALEAIKEKYSEFDFKHFFRPKQE